MTQLRFDGRTAIVTGSGGNPSLGRAHALLLASRGAPRVVILRMRHVLAMDATGLHALADVVVREFGDESRTEGKPGKEAPDGDHEPQHELACEEHGSPSDDRQDAQKDVSHVNNVGLGAASDRHDTCGLRPSNVTSSHLQGRRVIPRSA